MQDCYSGRLTQHKYLRKENLKADYSHHVHCQDFYTLSESLLVYLDVDVEVLDYYRRLNSHNVFCKFAFDDAEEIEVDDFKWDVLVSYYYKWNDNLVHICDLAGLPESEFDCWSHWQDLEYLGYSDIAKAHKIEKSRNEQIEQILGDV